MRRATDRSGATRAVGLRRRRREAMVRVVDENEADFRATLAADLGKLITEGYLSDIAYITSQAKMM